MSTRGDRDPPLTELDLWRRALARSRGREAWRGIRDLAEELTHDVGGPSGEPPPQPISRPGDLHRRDLFRLVGAGAALAGLASCSERRPQHIVAHGGRPECDPALPTAYATSMVLDGFAAGLLAQSYAGRPIKLEGNPEHPASLGASDALQQASILELYDANRARDVLHRGRPATRDAAEREARAAGGRPWFVLYPQSSPVVHDLVERIRTRYREARFCYHSPLERTDVYQTAKRVFGRALDMTYNFRAADRVLALDADFAGGMPMSVRWARDFAERRRLSHPGDDPGRLYAIEPSPTPTGSLADHRLAAPAGEVAAVAAAILVALVEDAGESDSGPAVAAAERLAGARHAAWARAVARDLARHRGRCLAIAGDRQPPEVHALAHAINRVLHSFGATVFPIPPAVTEPEGGETLTDLARALDAGRVDSLVILEANPMYSASPELGLSDLARRARHSLHLSLHYNETSRACQWFVPAAHYLESWGLARAYDGTLSTLQPLIEPLYGGSTVSEMLQLFASDELWARGTDRELVRGHLSKLGLDGERYRRALQRGLVADSAFAPTTDRPSWAAVAAILERAADARGSSGGLELCFERDPAVHDGRFANNGWLQELPRPMTKLTWDNAAVISPRTAVELGIETEDVVELQLDERSIHAPVLVLPGHADGAVSLALGYGRSGDEAIARGVGVNAFALRSQRHRGIAAGLRLTRTGRKHALAFTQDHDRMEGRDIVLHADLEHYRRHPGFTSSHRGEHPSLLPKVFDYSQGRQWAMSIDTMICTGCSSCVVACQAENNIPVVGKRGVRDGREMHWLRIDRYFSGPVEAPTILHQPMLCQHCEKAPCEYVCPVYATTHSPDGLNEMTYNRCVGTRFCSNNCPYKVRRFNWFEYQDGKTTEALQHNPSVTVRARGVMEKCTYCVQRIRSSEIRARVDGRELAPEEVKTACQQACPTGAIRFASLGDEDSEMVRWRRQPRRYDVLHELGTRPRTTYLARIRNPNPEIS